MPVVEVCLQRAVEAMHSGAMELLGAADMDAAGEHVALMALPQFGVAALQVV